MVTAQQQKPLALGFYSHLLRQLEDSSLSPLILHQLMFWEPRTVQRHLGVIHVLAQQVLEIPECYLGVLYGLWKDRQKVTRQTGALC